MSPEGQFTTLRDQIVGQVVTDRQLAGNSLSIWVNKVPGDGDRGWTIWLDPSWHILDPDRVWAGSMQAGDDEEESGWKEVTKIINGLVGRAVERLEVEPVTGDLTVVLTGDVRVRTFAADPRETHHWRIKNHASGDAVVGSPQGLSIEKAT